MSTDFLAALSVVETYAQAQAQIAADRLDEDNFESLLYSWPLTDARAAVAGAGPVVDAGGRVQLRFTVNGEEVVLESDGSDSWRPEGRDPSEVLPHLAGAAPRVTWPTDALTGGGAPGGLAAIAEGSAEVTFAKHLWTADIGAATGRSVWIGPTTAGFATWLDVTVPDAIAKKLFARPGGLVLLADWAIPPIGAEGRTLAIGGAGFRPPAAGDDHVLDGRLASRGESELLPAWRLVRLDLGALRDPVRVPMQRAIGITAARLLAEVDQAGAVRPSAGSPTMWDLPRTPSASIGNFTAVTALVRWIGDDLSEARMEVARDLAARRIEDPQTEAAKDPIVRAARLAYKLHVESDVRDSLAHQQKLEEGFRDLDDRVAEMRAKIAESLDGALTRAIAGALTITIASLTSAKVRDWPATIAGVVIAGYLTINAVNLWHLRGDSTTRLDEMASLAGQRVVGLGDTLKDSLPAWKKSIRKRSTTAVVLIAVVALAILIGGIWQNDKLWNRGEDKPDKPKSISSAPLARVVS